MVGHGVFKQPPKRIEEYCRFSLRSGAATFLFVGHYIRTYYVSINHRWLIYRGIERRIRGKTLHVLSFPFQLSNFPGLFQPIVASGRCQRLVIEKGRFWTTSTICPHVWCLTPMSHDISIQFPATSQQNPRKILATSHRIRVKIPAESSRTPAESHIFISHISQARPVTRWFTSIRACAVACARPPKKIRRATLISDHTSLVAHPTW